MKIPASLRLEDYTRQILAEILIFMENNEQPGRDVSVYYLVMPTYAMYALYQHNPNNPVTLFGSPIRYDPRGFLDYLATVASHIPQQGAWTISGNAETGERINILLPSTGTSVEISSPSVTRLAALLRLPASLVREIMSNHLTFKQIDDDGTPH